MSRPYELLVRFKHDGTVAGASARYIETVNGRDYELDPVPLAVAGAEVAEYADFAAALSASVVTERDELASELAQAQQQIATMTQQIAQAQQQITTLTQQLAAAQAELAAAAEAASQGDDAPP